MIKTISDLIIPRFITEYVALDLVDGELEYWMPAHLVDIESDGIPDGVIKVKSFNLFGISLCAKSASEVLTWDEYKNL